MLGKQTCFSRKYLKPDFRFSHKICPGLDKIRKCNMTFLASAIFIINVYHHFRLGAGRIISLLQILPTNSSWNPHDIHRSPVLIYVSDKSGDSILDDHYSIYTQLPPTVRILDQSQTYDRNANLPRTSMSADHLLMNAEHKYFSVNFM